MYISRELSSVLSKSIAHFKAITITGPRQSGKTTLIKNIFPDLPYTSLENPDVLLFAQTDPVGFLDQFKKGAILDEIQNAPQLFSYIQGIVDSNSEIKFIFSGSSNFTLLQNITQSLAGRTAIFTLLPFSFSEISDKTITLSDDEVMLNGFYPSIYASEQDVNIYYRSYFNTYIERDLRQIINIKDIRTFRAFVKLCAGRIGNIFNASSLANEVGVSVPTINNWISILEASYILYLLPPYYENVGKRLIKSPKLYFTDTGLACYLLGIENTTQLSRDPLRGAIFENLCVIDLLKQRYNEGYDSNLYFYRDNHQNEIDLLVKQGSMVKPVEIKSAKTFNSDFLKSLQFSEKVFKERISDPCLLYAGKLEQTVNTFQVANYRNYFSNRKL